MHDFLLALGNPSHDETMQFLNVLSEGCWIRRKDSSLMQSYTSSHLLFMSEGQVVLQVPQKLGLLFRFTQNRPLFVWQMVGADGSQLTVHCPAASSPQHLAGLVTSLGTSCISTVWSARRSLSALRQAAKHATSAMHWTFVTEHQLQKSLC